MTQAHHWKLFRANRLNDESAKEYHPKEFATSIEASQESETFGKGYVIVGYYPVYEGENTKVF